MQSDAHLFNLPRIWHMLPLLRSWSLKCMNMQWVLSKGFWNITTSSPPHPCWGEKKAHCWVWEAPLEQNVGVEVFTLELGKHVMSFWVTGHCSLIWNGPPCGTGLKCPPLFSSFIKADTVTVVVMLHRWRGARCHHLSSKHPEWQSLRWQNMNEEMRTEGSFKHIRRVCSPKFDKDTWISSKFHAEFITTWGRIHDQHDCDSIRIIARHRRLQSVKVTVRVEVSGLCRFWIQLYWAPVKKGCLIYFLQYGWVYYIYPSSPGCISKNVRVGMTKWVRFL